MVDFNKLKVGMKIKSTVKNYARDKGMVVEIIKLEKLFEESDEPEENIWYIGKDGNNKVSSDFDSWDYVSATRLPSWL